MNPQSTSDSTGVRRLYILTGEPSGEAHAAAVVRAMRDVQPDLAIRGIGGDAMAAEGVELVEHVRHTAIMGFAEVLRKIGYIRQLMARVKDDIQRFGPDRILIVDYPGFNLRMATWARKAGYPVDMYIAPQVWAWKRRRIHRMARDLQRLYVILPFEAAHYAEVPLRVEYVGHPLADDVLPPSPGSAADWRQRMGLPLDGQILALLPGSRRQEIERMLPCLQDAAGQLTSFLPVVAGAPGRVREDYNTALPVVFGETRALYRHATAGIVTSGTATLEAALSGMPQVVAYKTSPLTYRLARWFSNVRFISLVNLVLNREVVPELIQGACTPDKLSAALKDRCTPASLSRHQEDLGQLRTALSKKGAALNVARGVLRLDG